MDWGWMIGDGEDGGEGWGERFRGEIALEGERRGWRGSE